MSNQERSKYDALHDAERAELEDRRNKMRMEEILVTEPPANRFADSQTYSIPRGAEEASILTPEAVDERLKGQEFIACQSEEVVSIYNPDGQVDTPLSFEEYQAGAKETAIYNQDARVLYPALGLAGEVGELIEKAGGISAGVDVLLNGVAVCAGKCANQVKKVIRDDDCECDTLRKHAIGKEIGGVLWYCAAVASDLGLSLGDIAQENLDVLASRQERGVIQGDGDNR